MSYSLRDYGSMVSETRAQVYLRALEQAIRPGDVVLDLGAGTGLFSLVACRLGARRVHACDTNPAVQVARELARKNGFGDRVVCHEQRSDRLTLPEPVDVVVSDLRGILPLHGRHLPTLMDARKRLLRPGGALLPCRDLLWLALAETPQDYQRVVLPWDKHDFGFDLGPWSSLLAHTWISAQPKAAQLVSPAVEWATVDYGTVDSPDVANRVTCTASRAATVHGFFLWFDATIAAGIGFSAGPDAAKLPYGCGFFPWPRPVAMQSGDVAEIDLRAKLVGDDYVWTWRTQVAGATFSQSTFLGSAVSPELLRKRAAGHAVELNDDGRLVLRVLSGFAEGRTNAQIAAQLMADFPGRFEGETACLGFVGDRAARYGR